MDFFDRHKALIITSLICSILILSMYNIRMSNNSKKIRETLILLNEVPPKPSEVEQEQKPEEPPKEQPPTQFETHRAFNQNEQENQQDVDKRLEEIFNRNAAKTEAGEDENQQASSGDQDISTAASKKEKLSTGNNQTQASSVQPGSRRSSTISFSLQGRRAISIPNPIYTCDSAGKVVINITVNAAGAVTNTSVNKNASSTTNQCLTDMAQEYAQQAQFSTLAGRNNQPGTITYQFQN